MKMQIDPMTAGKTAFAVLLLFTSLAFAQSSCDVATKLDFGGTSGDPTAVNANWKTLSVLGLFISTLLISVVYMFGKMSDNAALLNRAKTDFVQVIATSILLVIFYSFLTAACNLDPHQFGLNANTMFDGARLYFEYAKAQAFYAYNEATNSIMLVSGLSSIFINSQVIAFGLFLSLSIADNPFVGFSIATGALQFVANLTMLTVAMASAHMDIFTIIERHLLNFLLPAGVTMRCFTPTREFGGVLIAIAVGLFIFYPLMFSLGYLVLGQPTANLSSSEAGWFSLTMGEAVLFGTFSILPYATLILIPVQIPFVGGIGSKAIADAIGAAGSTLLPVFILPAINWIVIAAFVRNLSRILGEEVDISSLGRLI
jgi:hypothetical protein